MVAQTLLQEESNQHTKSSVINLRQLSWVWVCGFHIIFRYFREGRFPYWGCRRGRKVTKTQLVTFCWFSEIQKIVIVLGQTLSQSFGRNNVQITGEINSFTTHSCSLSLFLFRTHFITLAIFSRLLLCVSVFALQYFVWFFFIKSSLVYFIVFFYIFAFFI